MRSQQERVSQREESLALANTIRIAAAVVRRQVEAGELTLDEALEHPDAQATKVGRLVVAVPRVGVKKTHRLLRDAGIMSGDRRVRDLTARQRTALVEALHRMRDRRATELGAAA